MNTEAVASVAWVLRGRRRTCKLAIQTKALIERSHSEGQIWKKEFIRLSIFLKNFSPRTRCTDWEHQGCFYKIPHKHRTFLRFSFLLVSGVCSVQGTTKTISCWLVDACARRSFEYKNQRLGPVKIILCQKVRCQEFLLFRGALPQPHKYVNDM